MSGLKQAIISLPDVSSRAQGCHVPGGEGCELRHRRSERRPLVALHYFVYVALAGIIGKVLISWLQGYVGALGLVVAGLCFPLTIGGFPVFILALAITVFFLEGGASNLAQATADAVLPAFLFLGVCSLAVGLAFSWLAIETHGRPLAQDHEDQGAPAGALKPAEGRS